MSPLNELRPFVSFCQACGLIPFSMEVHTNREISLTFKFSFKKIITWWFILIAIGQIVALYFLSQIYMETSAGQLMDEETSMTLVFLGVSTMSTIFFQMAVPRWIVIGGYRNLNNALHALQDVEERLGQISGQHLRPRSSITIRFTAGFTLILSSVRSLEGKILSHFNL